MKRRKLRSIFKKEIGAIKKHASRILIEESEEDVHQLRVAFKKIRAFSRLLSVVDKADRRHLLYGLKEIYVAAGKLRDLQIMYGLLSRYFGTSDMTDSPYMKELSIRIADARSRLCSLIEATSFTSVLSALAKTVPPVLTKSRFRKFIGRRAAAIGVILDEGADDERIHQIRKQLKDMQYCMTYFLRRKKRSTPIARKEGAIERLTSLLGDYHDKCMAEAGLRSACLDARQLKEAEALRRFKRKKSYQKHLTKESVIQQLYLFKFETLPFLGSTK